jgi:AraC-like DNA-binding protein
MERQTIRLTGAGAHHTAAISSMGLDHPEGTIYRQGKDWCNHQVCRHDTFSLVAQESRLTAADDFGYTRQEDYIKVNFWLSGRHTTVLDGFGQRDHERPELFITSGPWEMTKMDVIHRDTQTAVVALCLLPAFFPDHNKTYPISQIAEAVGYGQHCNFSTAFRNYYGCTPQRARDKRP